MTNEFIEMKKAKGTKKCVIKKMLKFEDYKCLLDDKVILKSQQRNHQVYTEDVNKIA